MPTRKPRSKRYNSEYQSHYQRFESKRPNTVKGELTRSIIPYGIQSTSSTPRAGLQSTQLGVIHEPPLQRKRIVPYEKNHNIFPTGTTKEVPDREWLEVDNTSRTDQYNLSPTRYKHHHSSIKEKINTKQRTESPILAAEKKLLKNTAEKIGRYPYVPDGVKRKSTYRQDFGVNGYRSKERNKAEKSPIREMKSKPVIGGKKSAISPDRMAPAGIRTMTSMGDKRLIQPSDNSQYMKSPERENATRVYDSEYSSRFKFVDGTWIESPEFQVRPSPEVKNKFDWYKEAITRRNEAYGYAQQARGTHFSREELDRQNRRNAQLYDDHEDSISSLSEVPASNSSKRNKKKNRNERKVQYDNKSDKPTPMKESCGKRPPSPVDSNRSFSTSEVTTTTTADEFFLERGRSPTPELRDTGLARRHHYDMTTNILNEKLRKSLTLSDEKRQKSKNQNGLAIPQKRTSPSSSVMSQDGSYVPGIRDDDVMSDVSMASRASTASKTLDRARKRRDKFWQNQHDQNELQG